LPLIEQAIKKCLPEPDKNATFVDFFSGSGSVAKLAKLMGFSVTANDWEYYSTILNKAFLINNQDDLKFMFTKQGGLQKTLDLLNNLPAPDEKTEYISKYYCPQDTIDADPDNERMFYTRENGEKIDSIRNWIETEYPGKQSDTIRGKEKNLLLGLLIYEAATHANTSGVFKAYHRGFGGRGKDALKRIMGEIELEIPQLINGNGNAEQMDAMELAKKTSLGSGIDIAYLDPPYNQHQYGSNYHLLNTIARNDKPPINQKITNNGKTVDKGGIRKDWTATRSEYCYKKSAEKSFVKLIESINAKYILISYSTEGIIPFEHMLDILGNKGRLDIVLSEYTRYRGGKQALSSTVSNVEFVLIVQPGITNTKADTARIQKILDTKKMEILLKRPVSPAVCIHQDFQMKGFANIHKDLTFTKKLNQNLKVQLTITNFKTISSYTYLLNGKKTPSGKLTPEQYKTGLTMLDQLTSISREEELSVTLNWIRYLLETSHSQALLSALPQIPFLMKKFNNRKAYELSLIYLKRILDLTNQIKTNNICNKEKRFMRFLEQLEKIITLKLSAPIPSSLQASNIQQMRISIINSFNKIRQ